MMQPRMLLRMLVRSLLVRRRSSITALLAIAVAAAVATTMLNLYVEVQSKVRGELRGYGANLILTVPGATSNPDLSRKVDAALGKDGVAVALAFAVARSADDQPVVVVGTDLDRIRRVNSFWQITPAASDGGVLIGAKAAAKLAGGSTELDLKIGDSTRHFRVGAIIRSGAADDSRIFVPLADFSSWTGLGPETFQIAANIPAEKLPELASRLAAAVPGAKVEAVRQIVEAEANVFQKTRKALLAAVIVIIITAVLCVFATLTSSVLERRRDFALMKALGASGAATNTIFAAEALALGLIGALLGSLTGIALATLIGRINFHSPIAPRFDVLPPVIIGSIILTLIAAAVPMGLLRSAQPAVLLKGE